MITIIEKNLKKNYFFKRCMLNIGQIDPQYYIKQRKYRRYLKHSKCFFQFKIGDIIEIIFYYKCTPLVFNGICIAIRKKYFVKPDVVFILRNIIIKIAIELTVSYYYNRLYKLKFLDYKRKFLTFNKNKLFFIRSKINRKSQID